MLAPELKKIKEQLEKGKNATVDADIILKELQELEDVKGYLTHSISLSSTVCPTCGRRL